MHLLCMLYIGTGFSPNPCFFEWMRVRYSYPGCSGAEMGWFSHSHRPVLFARFSPLGGMIRMQPSTAPSDAPHGTLSPDGVTSGHGETDLLLQAGHAKASRARVPSGRIPFSLRAFWQQWAPAIQAILPVYLALHLGIFLINCLAFLFVVPDSSALILPVSTLWQEWLHWDAAHFIRIAEHGYTELYQMAFFPLYPLLERGVMTVTQDALIAGLLVSNVAEFILFVVLYRLIAEIGR